MFDYDSNDRLLSDTCDNNENTLTSPSFAMSQPDQYDLENRLIRRAKNGKTVTIVYDGDGNRVKKTVATSTNILTTRFLVDMMNPTGYAQVLEEITTTQTTQDSPHRKSRALTVTAHDLISQHQFVANG
jgi:YD repeat-containing protein